MSVSLRIASRKSELALVQARYVQSLLGGEIVEIISSGDQDLTRPLYALPDMGVFVRALEVKMLDGEADLAVHSLKDMPTEHPAGLTLAAVPEIQHPRGDVVVMSPQNQHLTIDTLPQGAVVGTSSLRRQACLANLYGRDHFQFVAIRGNLNTRIRKLAEGQADCLILAAAGIFRLGWQDSLHVQHLDEKVYLHAPAQAALGLECPVDSAFLPAIKALEHADSRSRCDAERSFMKELEGGCKVPIGVWSAIQGDELLLIGQVWHTNGRGSVRKEIRGRKTEAAELGRQLAVLVREGGADRILAEVRAETQALVVASQ